MSNIGKISFLIAGLFLIASGVARVILGPWEHLWIFSLAGAVLLLVGIAFDYKFYLSFLSMRTTKHGLNMGAVILLVFALIAGANFIAVRHNKTFDVTSEKINSLSPQSVQILQKITDPLEVKLFYRRGNQDVEQVKGRFRKLIQMYEEVSPQVKLEYVDILKRPDLKDEFQLDKEAAAAFIVYKGKKNKVDELTEEAITRALIKVTREKSKAIYFTTGHGERNLNSSAQEVEGASDLKKELTDASYEVKDIKLFETGAIPTDAQVLAIIGPQKPFIDSEIKLIREYAVKGGKLFIALDPGTQQNLTPLLAQMGVDFQNNYIVDQFGQIVGVGASVALGVGYSKTSDITKRFNEMMSLFPLASALKKDPSADVVTEDIVSTGQSSFVIKELVKNPKVSQDTRGPHVVAMTSQGKGGTNDSKDAKAPLHFSTNFQAVIFGDSDFLTNQFLYQQVNRDLALNGMAHLSQDTDIISIRPKKLEATPVNITEQQFAIFVLAFLLPLPIVMFSLAGLIWYRRRNA